MSIARQPGEHRSRRRRDREMGRGRARGGKRDGARFDLGARGERCMHRSGGPAGELAPQRHASGRDQPRACRLGAPPPQSSSGAFPHPTRIQPPRAHPTGLQAAVSRGGWGSSIAGSGRGRQVMPPSTVSAPCPRPQSSPNRPATTVRSMSRTVAAAWTLPSSAIAPRGCPPSRQSSPPARRARAPRCRRAKSRAASRPGGHR